MQKLFLLMIVAALLLVAPSALAGGGQKYEGDFSGTGSVRFKVEKRQDGKKVVNYRFSDLVVNCGGIPKLTSGNLNFAVSVNRNKFETKAVVGNPSNPKSSLSLKGELNKRKASGTLRVFGSDVIVGGDPPERDDCDSGRTSWDASR